MSKKSKQPLLQNPGVVGVLASLLSIVIGLVLGFILLVVLNPGASLEGMKAMMTTGFASMDKLGKVLYQAAPLMMCGLSVGFAFKTGLFNIGAPGQYTMGSFFALLCAIQFQLIQQQVAPAYLSGIADAHIMVAHRAAVFLQHQALDQRLGRVHRRLKGPAENGQVHLMLHRRAVVEPVHHLHDGPLVRRGHLSNGNHTSYSFSCDSSPPGGALS